ncbi:hypothetical protein JW756_05640 [Candidatus Woesearchaeota archaeon]|nr:hypothetical protein [Candidatus Woesearchaeota archaeon]
MDAFKRSPQPVLRSALLAQSNQRLLVHEIRDFIAPQKFRGFLTAASATPRAKARDLHAGYITGGRKQKSQKGF